MAAAFISDSGTCPVVCSSYFDGVPHGISTRYGGVSTGPYRSLNLGLSTADSDVNVLENRRRFVESVGFRREAVSAARLVHGRQVATFHRDRRSGNRVRAPHDHPETGSADRVFHADGVVSDVPGLAFFMTFADCVPLLFADPLRGVIGAAHAGWRGTALGIAAEVVSVMRRDYGCDPSQILAAVGPSIGPCCYEVSEDVPAHFASTGAVPVLIHTPDQRVNLDLWETNRRQLLDAGMETENIDCFSTCTSCNPTDYFSHRRDNGVTGRFGLCIGRDVEA